MSPEEGLKKVFNEYNKMKAERDTCLEDIEKLRKRNKELAQLLTEFSHHIGSNPSSSTYKKFRKQLYDIGIVEHE